MAALAGLAAAFVLALPAAGTTPDTDDTDEDTAATDTDVGEGAGGAQGVIQTLTGPAYCPGLATPEPASREVRALAIDREARPPPEADTAEETEGENTQEDAPRVVFYETGPPDTSRVATVDTQGQVDTLASDIPPPPQPPGVSATLQETTAEAGRMVVDGDGGVIIAGGTRLVRIHRDDSRTTVAGDPAGQLGTAGPDHPGDGGPVEEARFRSATSLSRDTDGNLYVADHGGPALETASVRFLNRSEEPVTFYPDTAHDLTVAPGEIDTIAGTPGDEADDGAGDDDAGEEGDTARSAVLSGTTRIAVVGERLYLATHPHDGQGRAVVRLANMGGEPLTVHGQTVPPGGVQVVAGGGDDPTTTLDSVAGVAADADGNLYIADPARHRIHRVDDEGFMATFAGAEGLGASVGGFNGNRRPAVGARLDRPTDVALGPDGDVYVADRGNGQVRIVDDTGHIRGAPGAGVALAWHCQAPGETADEPPETHPGGPASVATDPQGNTFVALPGAHQVKRRDPSGRVTTVAGRTGQQCPLGCAGFDGDGGPAVDAQLDTPTAVALGPGNNLYLLDGGNARVRFVNLSDAPITVHGVPVDPSEIATVAGTGTPGRSGDNGPALDAQLGEVADPELVRHGERAAEGYRLLPRWNFGDLTVDAQRNLFIAETDQDPPDWPNPERDADGNLTQPRPDFRAQVRHVTPAGQISTIAGTGAPGAAGECCHDPAGLALDGDGNLYIADATNSQIWLLNRTSDPLDAHGQAIDPGEPAVIAGSGTRGFDGDGGPATAAQLLSPAGLDLADDGTLLFTELEPRGSYVRSVDAAGTIDLVAGSGTTGFNGDGLDPLLTSLNLPTDVAVDPCSNLIVADAGNDRTRRLNLTGPCDPAAQQAAGAADGDGPVAATVGLVALAVVIIAGGFVGGWYWRRRTHNRGPASRVKAR